MKGKCKCGYEGTLWNENVSTKGIEYICPNCKKVFKGEFV